MSPYPTVYVKYFARDWSCHNLFSAWECKQTWLLPNFVSKIDLLVHSFQRMKSANIYSMFFRIHAFQGPGFSRSRFLSVRFQCPGPDFRSSQERRHIKILNLKILKSFASFDAFSKLQSHVCLHSQPEKRL